MKLRNILAIGLTLAALGCGSAGRVDVDDAREEGWGATGTTSQDIGGMCREMAGELLALPAIKEAAAPPTIALLHMDNKTNDYMDTDLVLRKIRIAMMKAVGGKIIFADRASYEAVAQERKSKQAGSVTQNAARANDKVLGADYFLTGEVAAIVKRVDKGKTEYTVWSFRLTDAQTSQVLWEDEYEFKKYHKKGWFDR
ncbi:MAG TPA: hypothetical protein PL033_06860 [Candidatus Brocadiia bacterium]|nr:hypothetical protein [Candidatus Brocadiia bacterium]